MLFGFFVLYNTQKYKGAILFNIATNLPHNFYVYILLFDTYSKKLYKLYFEKFVY